jgi:predicted ribosomally synthesized peptide with nif11-like leader
MSKKSESIGAGQRLLEKMRTDQGLRGKIEATTTFDSFLSAAKAVGYDLSGITEAEARALVRGDGRGIGEISDQELAQVSGGVVVSGASGVQSEGTGTAIPYQPPSPGPMGGGW